MKKIIISIATLLVLFSSCEKEKCKQQQAKALESELIQFQRELSNTNLTQAQIAEITKRHNERNQKILALCN